MKLLWILLLCLGTVSPSIQVEHRQKKLAFVLAELGARDVAHLAPAQRTARVHALRELAAYARAGRFPVNTDYPGWEMPYFIDRFGTRCALAHVIDRSGQAGLVRRLAREDNNAYVARLLPDEELAGWLTRHGLTAQEAALIQAPGFSDPPPELPDPPRVDPPPGNRVDKPKDPTHETPDPDKVDSSRGTRPTDPGTLWKRRSAKSSSAGSWQTWWELNRAAHVNLRARYHESFSVTPLGRGLRGGGVRPRRPSHKHFVKEVHPLLAQGKSMQGKLRDTSLFALARTAGAGEREAAAERVLKYLADASRPNRDLMILALGVSREELAFDPLVDIAVDSPDGRKALASRTPLPVRMRAFAVLALGAMGDVDAVPEIRGLLAGKERKKVDLGRACVASLGLLGTKLQKDARKELGDFLASGMSNKEWPRLVRAGVPTALAHLGRWVESAQFLAGFREPREVRQSCALALGVAAPDLSLDLVETLEASALRDTDALVRRFSAVALGEIAARMPRRVTADDESVQRAARFFAGALKGMFKQPGDRPWQTIGAALFARRFRTYADSFGERIGRLAKSKINEQRAAAALGLGLLDRPVGFAVLAKLAQAKDPVVRAYAAEARGMLRDRAARDDLLSLCQKDKSMRVRYHAARGLAMLGDSTVIGPLVDAMAAERAQAAQAALTRVIGEMGDRAAIEPLKKIAADNSRGLWTRRHALAALGVLGQNEDQAWTHDFRRGANFAATTPTLRTVLSLF